MNGQSLAEFIGTGNDRQRRKQLVSTTDDVELRKNPVRRTEPIEADGTNPWDAKMEIPAQNK